MCVYTLFSLLRKKFPAVQKIPFSCTYHALFLQLSMGIFYKEYNELWGKFSIIFLSYFFRSPLANQHNQHNPSPASLAGNFISIIDQRKDLAHRLAKRNAYNYLLRQARTFKNQITISMRICFCSRAVVRLPLRCSISIN